MARGVEASRRGQEMQIARPAPGGARQMASWSGHTGSPRTRLPGALVFIFLVAPDDVGYKPFHAELRIDLKHVEKKDFEKGDADK